MEGSCSASISFSLSLYLSLSTLFLSFCSPLPLHTFSPFSLSHTHTFSPFSGFIGAINVICMWPFFFLLDAVGIEKFTQPPGEVVGALFLNGLFGTVLSDYLWARSVLLTSPLVATLGEFISFFLSLSLFLSFILPFSISASLTPSLFHSTSYSIPLSTSTFLFTPPSHPFLCLSLSLSLSLFLFLSRPLPHHPCCNDQ